MTSADSIWEKVGSNNGTNYGEKTNYASFLCGTLT